MIKNPVIAFQTEGHIYIKAHGEFKTEDDAVKAARYRGTVIDHDFETLYGNIEIVEQDK